MLGPLGPTAVDPCAPCPRHCAHAWLRAQPYQALLRRSYQSRPNAPEAVEVTRRLERSAARIPHHAPLRRHATSVAPSPHPRFENTVAGEAEAGRGALRVVDTTRPHLHQGGPAALHPSRRPPHRGHLRVTAARFDPPASRRPARLPAAASDVVSEGWAFESLLLQAYAAAE